MGEKNKTLPQIMKYEVLNTQNHLLCVIKLETEVIIAVITFTVYKHQLKPYAEQFGNIIEEII